MANVKDEPILKFLVNYLWGQMSIQSSQFFLPAILAKQANSYDPYSAGDWDLGTLPDNNDAVCLSGNDPGTCIGNPTLKLSGVVIKGLYNLQPNATRPVVTNTNVKASMDFCTLPVTAPHVTSQYVVVTGRYQYDQECLSSDGKSKFPVEGTGSFTATIFSGQGSGDLDIIPDPNDSSKLKVVMNSMTLGIPATFAGKLCTAPGASSNSNICISIKMDSGPDYNFLANQAANYKKVSEMIVTNINQKLTDPNVLTDLGKVLTNAVNNIFSSASFANDFELYKAGIE